MGCIVNGEPSMTIAACAIKFAALLNGIHRNNNCDDSIRNYWKKCINSKM